MEWITLEELAWGAFHVPKKSPLEMSYPVGSEFIIFPGQLQMHV
jgi:hypothetical protein